MSNFERKFMETLSRTKEKAEFPNNKITNLRYDLIKEELNELKVAIENRDIKRWPCAIDIYMLLMELPRIWYKSR